MWELFHRYRRLAEEGKVQPLSCPDCATQLVTRVDRRDEDQVLLWCPSCPSMKKPGLDVLDKVKAVVSEHYV